MDVWTVIFANLVANGMKKLSEVPENLRENVTELLAKNNEPV